MFKKISSNLLFLTANTSLRFHVVLSGKGEDGVTDVPDAFHSVFENNFGKYISYEVKSFITLEIKDKIWNKSKSLLLTPSNIFQFMTHLNKLIANIYRNDCFFYTSERKLRVNQDKITEYSVDAFNLTGDQRVMMQPTVYYDNEENEYEGAIFYINNTENYFIIPIDKIETLKYEISQVNFVIYTGVYLNSYFHTLYEKEKETKVELIKPKTSVFAMKRDDTLTSENVEAQMTISTTTNDIKSPEKLLDI